MNKNITNLSPTAFKADESTIQTNNHLKKTLVFFSSIKESLGIFQRSLSLNDVVVARHDNTL